jgi:1-deoxy-D-xylulose-5-phosphate reductoisomerase
VDAVSRVVDEHGTPPAGTELSVPDVLEAERWARARARELAKTTEAGN